MILFAAAILPVIVLCYFIYNRDPHKEPKSILAKLFGLGLLIFIPVLFCELAVGGLFDTENVTDFGLLFINTFLGVALIEEFWKWLVVRKVGFEHREFNEVYDAIVYAVFVSLGFACIENVGYVGQYGLVNAFTRALSAIPGHMYFGVIMGYFFSRAKVAKFNSNNSMYVRNMILSLLFPALFHTMYDGLLFYFINTDITVVLVIFFLFHLVSFGLCIWVVFMTSKLQYNISNRIAEGEIIVDKSGRAVIKHQPHGKINFCPICGRKYEGGKFCGGCGNKF